MDIELHFHWPHDRLAIGFEHMAPDDEYKYRTIRFYLAILTITINT